MAFYSKKEHKLWIWKAVTYPARQLVGLVTGRRDTKTAEQLLKQITSKFQAALYCTDDLKADSKVLPETQHIIGKAGTFAVEQHNSDTRHWLARFRRKSKVVSKSPKAVEEGIRLVEHLHYQDGLKQLQALHIPLLS